LRTAVPQLTNWQGCFAIVGGCDDQSSGPPMPSPTNPAHLQGGIGLRFIVPVAGLMLGALALVGGMLWVGSLKQDELGLSHQRQLVEHALRSTLGNLSITAKDYSWWDDAVRYLVWDLDPDWADSNPGIYIHETFGYDYSFVVDGGDRTLYAAIDGARASAAGLLAAKTKRRSISLGDRACLALAIELGMPVLTGDRAWRDLDIGVEIRLFRELM